MTGWISIAAVALGGAIGSVGRYLTVLLVAGWLGVGFPWGTLAVNVLGSTMMGLLFELFSRVAAPPDPLRALLLVGVLGGFTTFSSFSLDVAVLVQRGDWAAALGYVAASVILSLAGLFAGMALVRALAAG